MECIPCPKRHAENAAFITCTTAVMAEAVQELTAHVASNMLVLPVQQLWPPSLLRA